MSTERIRAAVIGAGPAGLAAAEVLAEAGIPPVIFEAKPSAARKFLMAGKSGLNLTKDQPTEAFCASIGCPSLDPILRDFGPQAVCDWAEGLGEPLFTGSSGRVFPKAMKGSPLLRKWMARLAGAGAELRTRWRWTGWDDGALTFETPGGPRHIHADATILALGGASWPRLGSDAAWVPMVRAAGVPFHAFEPANMGFDTDWPPGFADRFAGLPVKPAALSVGGLRVRGEFVISRTGIEGSAVYAISAALREALKAGQAGLLIDLVPDVATDKLTERIAKPRGKASLSNHLRKTAGITGVRMGLLRACGPALPDDPAALAARIKALPIPVIRPRPIAEAISSAGGLAWHGVDENLMLRALPGVYAAGEMLDWEAPTGGYLLTACIATGRHAGRAAAVRLAQSL